MKNPIWIRHFILNDGTTGCQMITSNANTIDEAKQKMVFRDDEQASSEVELLFDEDRSQEENNKAAKDIRNRFAVALGHHD